MIDDKRFNTSVGIKMSPVQVVQTIIDYMSVDNAQGYKITIGSDSELPADKIADFVSAIVVHRVGRGARYFWRRFVNGKKFHTLRDRMVDEVLLSLEVAEEFLKTTKKFDMPKFDFEIHVDIGEKGPTKDMIQELTGIIRANNFEVKTKPDSYAASKVADRHGKRKG